MAEGSLVDQDDNDIADQDGNIFEIYGLNGIRISKIGNPLYLLEIPEINESWFNKAEKTNVLQLNQIVPFTPTNDYEPSTKKYVDDEIFDSVSNTVTIVMTDNYIIPITDKTVAVRYTNTDKVTLTLPSAANAWNSVNSSGLKFLIKDIEANAFYNNITINADGSDTIIDSLDNQTSTIIDSNGGAVWVQAISSSEWIIY